MLRLNTEVVKLMACRFIGRDNVRVCLTNIVLVNGDPSVFLQSWVT